MEVTIIGTGNMARGIGTRLIAGGHQVSLLGKERSRAEELASELGEGASAADEITGDAVVLAVYHWDTPGAIEQYSDQLGGKILIDVTAPLTQEFDLAETPAGSAAQEIAAKVPSDTSVVKAFNTTFANTLMSGEVNGQTLDVFVAGDDEDAKRKVVGLVEDGGLEAIDVGPLARAREVEAMGFLHIKVQDQLGTGFGSALKVVR